MAMQRAIILSHIIGTGTEANPFRCVLVDLMQPGESISYISSKSPDANDACVIEAEADETRISLMDGTAHKVIWTRYVDVLTPVLNFDPDTPFSAAQVTALNTWMQTKYGVTGTQIASWFGITGAQLSNWLQTHPKSEAIEKLIQAWRQKLWK